MTLCAFRVESARKGAISKAQRSFCERRRQVRDETSTRTQLERWPGFGHRWSRLQRPSTSHSYVTHLVVRSNPRTKASASVPSLAALRWHRNCSMNQSINSRPRTIRLLQQLLPCSPQGARQRHAVSLDPRPIWRAVSLRHLADKARSSAPEIQRLREPRHPTTASAIMRARNPFGLSRRH